MSISASDCFIRGSSSIQRTRFGIDDQEFVVAFETNFPEDFLDLVQQLRETEISLYTLEDTPIFSCVRVQPMEMLNRLG